jgi:hypothetical protein
MFLPAHELIRSGRNYEISRRNLRNSRSLTTAPNLDLSIWIADAPHRDGTRFVVRAEQKLTAFLN